MTTGRMSLRRRRRRRRRRRARRRCAWPARSSTPPSTRSRGRSPRPRAARAPLPAVEGFANRAGLGVEGVVEGHARRRRAAPALLAEPALTSPAALEAAPRARRRAAHGRSRRRLGRRGRRASVVVADTVKPTLAPRRSPGCARSACARSLLTGDNAPTAARGGGARWASTR